MFVEPRVWVYLRRGKAAVSMLLTSHASHDHSDMERELPLPNGTHGGSPVSQPFLYCISTCARSSAADYRVKCLQNATYTRLDVIPKYGEWFHCVNVCDISHRR